MQSTCTVNPSSKELFDYFCFESTDTSSVILNYISLKDLLKSQSIEQVVQGVAQYVHTHMTKRGTREFTFHLFCNGMVIRDMAQHRLFMLHFARLFKDNYPKELQACYVHNAPSFFSSIYELFRPILPKTSRDKIILIKPEKNKQLVEPKVNATLTNSAIDNSLSNSSNRTTIFQCSAANTTCM